MLLLLFWNFRLPQILHINNAVINTCIDYSLNNGISVKKQYTYLGNLAIAKNLLKKFYNIYLPANLYYFFLLFITEKFSYALQQREGFQNPHASIIQLQQLLTHDHFYFVYSLTSLLLLLLYLFIYLFIYLFGCVWSQLQHVGSSLWRAGFPLVVACGLQSVWAQQLLAPQNVESQFPSQGSNPHPLHWKVDS